jgi:hypothetical protein
MANPTGRTSGANVTGLDEFMRALKKIDKRFGPEFKKAHKKVAERADQWSEWEAAGGTRIQQLMLSAIKNRATEKDARVYIQPSKKNAFANPAFWGAKKRTGWFADPLKYKAYDSQFDKWVGKSWDVAVAGQGPYAINPALAKHMPDILDVFEDALFEIAAPAFPDP